MPRLLQFGSLFAVLLSLTVFSLSDPAPPVAPAAPTQPLADQTIAFVAHGTVRDPDGKPLANALLSLARLTNAVPSYVTRTNEQGQFAIETRFPASLAVLFQRGMGLGIEEGSFPFTVYAPGLAPAFKLLKGDKPADNDITLAHGTTGTGRILDPDGKPVTGAIVRAQLFRPANPGAFFDGFVWINNPVATDEIARAFQVATDADGRFTLRDLPVNGKVYISLNDPRFVSESGQLSIQEASKDGAVLAPAPSPTGVAETGTLTARPGARLGGRVLYPDGKPAVGVSVTAVGADNATGIFANTVETSGDGSYLLFGLPSGKVALSVLAPSAEWATINVPNVSLMAGQQTGVSDITLSHGVLLTGHIYDADTKAPVAGASIALGGDDRTNLSPPSDAQGQYRVRVQPGEVSLSLGSVPTDYLYDYRPASVINVTEGSHTAPDFTLRKGVMLSGTAYDEAGHPAVGASITIPNSGIADSKVDAEGKWILHGIDPKRYSGDRTQPQGTIKLAVKGAWEIVGNTKFSLPSPPIALTLRHITLQNVTVRVVTTGGKSVPGATVSYRIFSEVEGNQWNRQTATSDDRGEFVLHDMRPEQSAEATATKKGYVLVTKGMVSRFGPIAGNTAGGLLSAHDIVMMPMDATIRGRVLDANRKPAVGARVALLSPGDLRELPDTSVQTDAEGRFALGGVPNDEITVGAARGRAFGQVTARPNQPVEIILASEEAVSPPKDIESAFAILERYAQATGTNGNGKAWSRVQVLSQMAVRLIAYDPDRATRAATDNKGYILEAFLGPALQILAQQDGKRAAAWGWALLPHIEKSERRTEFSLLLATLTAKDDPTRARQTYDSVAANIMPTEITQEAAQQYAGLAALAGALGDPDAEGWRQALSVAFDTTSATAQHYEQLRLAGGYAKTIAVGDLAGAEAWITGLKPRLQVRALAQLVMMQAKRDLPTAKRLLVKLEALAARPEVATAQADTQDPEWNSPTGEVNTARSALVRAMFDADPQGALELAQHLPKNDSSYIVVLSEAKARVGVRGQKDLISEALDAARNDYQNPAGELARIAAMIGDAAPQLSEQGFRDARQQLAKRNDDTPWQDEGAAGYAYAHAPFDPAESRLLLENEWLRLNTTLARINAAGNKQEDNKWSVLTQLKNTTYAMTPLNTGRAEVMLNQLEASDGEAAAYTSQTRRQIVEWLLADQATRRAKSLQEYETWWDNDDF